jgi:putative NIF3 family GTP cyclohydrolase 1 type 2
MEPLAALVARLDEFFDIAGAGADPVFARYLPETYDRAGIDWRNRFVPSFAERFNGLMLEGAGGVHTVFLSAFPGPEVLDAFLAQAREGDLLFLHHPIDLESGDPLGEPGRGFLPIAAAILDRLAAQRLSVYSCHAPMDVHTEIGTTAAMVKGIGASVEDRFWPYANGFAGAICAIEPIGTLDLMALLRYVFGITFVDFAGRLRQQITRLAVVAGAGYKVDQMREAEAKGAQAYLSGEIFDRIDTERGRELFSQVEGFALATEMALIGVSHAASEYLVMKTQMAHWLREHFALEVALLPPARWWR